MSEVVTGLLCELFIAAFLIFYAVIALALVVSAVRGELYIRRRAEQTHERRDNLSAATAAPGA
jgi:hypothetical protein